jgi:hypothetical protein
MTQGKNSIDSDGAAQFENAQAGSNADTGEQKAVSNMLKDSDVTDDGTSVILDQRIQAQIGQQLTTFYRELVDQPIPQNFMDLLARLDRQEDSK